MWAKRWFLKALRSPVYFVFIEFKYEFTKFQHFSGSPPLEEWEGNPRDMFLLVIFIGFQLGYFIGSLNVVSAPGADLGEFERL